MKILVCGGRYYSNEETVRITLAKLFGGHEERILIHGGAPGADTLAGSVARAMGATVRVYHADWKKHGRTAARCGTSRCSTRSAKDSTGWWRSPVVWGRRTW